MMIIYLHGFLSSPLSAKATALRQYMTARGLAGQLWCEQLPPAPRDAIALIDAQIARCNTPPTLIGSSLGGYYATWLAERHDLRAVLINPAVPAALTLEPSLGPHTNPYTGEVFNFTHAHLDQLRELEVPRLSRPARYWVLLEEGDEVLDYRNAVAKYQGARQTVLPGGNHGFSRWNDYLDDVLAYAGL